MSSTTPYVNQKLFFCRNTGLFNTIKKCPPPLGASPAVGYTATPEVDVTVPPKKARVFNKPQHQMSQSERRKWASRNKYR